MADWPLTETYTSAAGEVRWDRFGDAERDPVVLLHGTPFSSYIWRTVAPALARTHRVYVWDMPGYGASETVPGQDLSLAALAGVFAGLLNHWQLTNPAIVAHDSGGAVALGAHLRHRVGYGRLALVDAVALAPWGSPFFTLVGEHPDAFRRLPSAQHQALLRAYVDTASSPGLHPKTLDRLVEPWLDEDGQAAFYRQLTQRLPDTRYTSDLQADYESIDVPVGICWGSDDTWIPLDRGRELAARIRGAQLDVIPGAGHLVQEDDPAGLTAALLDFLHQDESSPEVRQTLKRNSTTSPSAMT
jgi:pimeloyl-ACP methyl ester carboxylesterase